MSHGGRRCSGRATTWRTTRAWFLGYGIILNEKVASGARTRRSRSNGATANKISYGAPLGGPWIEGNRRAPVTRHLLYRLGSNYNLRGLEQITSSHHCHSFTAKWVLRRQTRLRDRDLHPVLSTTHQLPTHRNACPRFALLPKCPPTNPLPHHHRSPHVSSISPRAR